MSQHDLDIANQTASNARADINLALKALGSLNSGSSAPATTYANMLWYDTTNNTLKMRAEANDAWISVGYLDQGSDAFRIFDDTQVVNASGTQTGLIGDQATLAWEAGTSTTESLVSPAKVKAAIDEIAVGWGYSSASTNISANSTTTFTHNLNTLSPIVQVEVICTTSNNGYSVGDIVHVASSATGFSRGILVVVDNVNSIKLLVAGTTVLGLNKGTRAEFSLDYSQWNFIVRARK